MRVLLVEDDPRIASDVSRHARSVRLLGGSGEQRRGGVVPRRHRGLRRRHPRPRSAEHGRTCRAEALARQRTPHAGSHPDGAGKLGRAGRRDRRRRRRLPAKAVPDGGVARPAARDRAALIRECLLGHDGRRDHARRAADEGQSPRRSDHAFASANTDWSPTSCGITGGSVSQQELDENVYGHGEEHDSNTLEVLVGRVRKKLGADAIETRRGFGYLMPEVHA